MSDLTLTPSLLAMLERIERHTGSLLLLAVTASGGQYGKLNKLRGAGYVLKCDHPRSPKVCGLRRLWRSPRQDGQRSSNTVPNSREEESASFRTEVR
jgi:hypothetical protein